MREAHGEIAQPGRGQPAKACSEAGRQRRATTEHVAHRNGRYGGTRKNGCHASPIHLQHDRTQANRLSILQHPDTNHPEPDSE